MLYREIIAVCSQIRTKHINTLCGQNVELYVKLVVRIVTSGSKGLNKPAFFSSKLRAFRIVLSVKFGCQTFSCVHRILTIVWIKSTCRSVDHTTVQAVSRWILTPDTRFGPQGRPVGFVICSKNVPYLSTSRSCYSTPIGISTAKGFAVTSDRTKTRYARIT